MLQGSPLQNFKVDNFPLKVLFSIICPNEGSRYSPAQPLSDSTTSSATEDSLEERDRVHHHHHWDGVTLMGWPPGARLKPSMEGALPSSSNSYGSLRLQWPPPPPTGKSTSICKNCNWVTMPSLANGINQLKQFGGWKWRMITVEREREVKD